MDTSGEISPEQELTADYWLCRCKTCHITYGLPKSKTRQLQDDIGKARCPECGKLLFRTKRDRNKPTRIITRKAARLD